MNIASSSAREMFIPAGSGDSRIGRLCLCLPSSLTSIKDWLHLVLVLGVISSVTFVALQIDVVMSREAARACESLWCVRQWIAAAVVLPSIWDFVKFIGTYDESLQAHQERAEGEVNRLIQEVNGQVADMHNICGKLTESADDFASRAFNQSLAQFDKFISDIRRFYSNLYEDVELLGQLRAFVGKWFLVYSQSQLDQDNNPSVRGLKQSLAKCKTVQEICEKAKERLSMLKMSTRIALVPVHSFLLNPEQGRAAPIMDAGLEEGPPSDAVAAGTIARSPGKKCGISWLRLGWAGFGRQGPRARDGGRMLMGLPCTIGFGFGSITILSARHLQILLYLVVDVAMLCWEAWECYNQFEQPYTVALLVANIVCVMSTLACFEQIDEIAKLQKRIAKYQSQSAKVKEEKKKATHIWEKVQQLHDLWNYRTMPCLAIMGKIHHALDDMDRKISHERPEFLGRDERLSWLQLANESFEALDQKLGAPSEWTKSFQAPLSDEWKETVGRQLRGAEKYDDVDKLIGALPLLANPRLDALTDGSASEECSSRRGSKTSLGAASSASRSTPC